MYDLLDSSSLFFSFFLKRRYDFIRNNQGANCSKARTAHINLSGFVDQEKAWFEKKDVLANSIMCRAKMRR